MNGLKYALSIVAISCAGILLNAGPLMPETYEIPEIEYADPDAAPAGEQPAPAKAPSCPCGDDCDCRGKSPAPAKQAASAKVWRVGDTIEVDGGTATVTKVTVEANGKVRLQWARPKSGHWTYPGDIASHLQSGHGVSPSGMSHQQMLDTHDALHESQPVRSLPRQYSQPAVSSGCPGGVCPPRYSAPRRVFRSW